MKWGNFLLISWWMCEFMIVYEEERNEETKFKDKPWFDSHLKSNDNLFSRDPLLHSYMYTRKKGRKSTQLLQKHTNENSYKIRILSISLFFKELFVFPVVSSTHLIFTITCYKTLSTFSCTILIHSFPVYYSR